MEKSFMQTDERLARYAVETFQPEDPVLAEIRERSVAAGLPAIQVGTMDALHLETLTRAVGARNAVEIGTLGGYSGTAIARALGPGGKLYTFDVEPRHAEVARESFRKAGVADRVETIVGSAVEKLPSIDRHGPFDLVFIDADKLNYPRYLAWAADHLRVGGVVLGDNTFGWGMIADEKFDDAEDEANIRGLQAFNRELARGGRFRATILPTGEGLTMGVKLK
ncbi:MAG: O-methyltransferase [Deltaproteobacteria bacterium]|nr:O-methyltransferase [Deltaproteobacteria bacterium]